MKHSEVDGQRGEPKTPRGFQHGRKQSAGAAAAESREDEDREKAGGPSGGPLLGDCKAQAWV